MDLAKLDVHGVDDPFSLQCLNFGIYHILRDLKYHARILVPNGYSLVGEADIHGYLEEGEVFVCIAHSDGEEPVYIEGPAMVTRSPTSHPGDVQLVTAIGRPPPGTVFDLEPLTNTVVFSTRAMLQRYMLLHYLHLDVGTRPLASYLSGGDLDGELLASQLSSSDKAQAICL